MKSAMFYPCRLHISAFYIKSNSKSRLPVLFLLSVPSAAFIFQSFSFVCRILNQIRMNFLMGTRGKWFSIIMLHFDKDNTMERYYNRRRELGETR